MKIIRFIFVIAALILSINSNAQGKPKTAPHKIRAVEDSKLTYSVGLGISNYLGDLIKNSSLYKQSSYSFSAGVAYEFIPHLHGRMDIGILHVRGADSKTGGAHKSRNLSFASSVFDLAIAAEYDIIDIKIHTWDPYILVGIGATFFDPTAKDIAGNKQKLRELGTDGQGLPGYPGYYNRTALIFPVGIGLKYAVSKVISLQLELNYRFTKTDYLDDVSINGYTDKALLDEKNPLTAKFTWRGNEVGGETYPQNLKLPRGNPKNKDGYYTTQFKIGVKL